MSTDARAVRPKKRKQAPLGKMMWLDGRGDVWSDRDDALFVSNRRGTRRCLVIDMSNPDAVVEAMARAYAERHGYVWQDTPDGVRRIYMAHARAAIAALGYTQPKKRHDA